MSPRPPAMAQAPRQPGDQSLRGQRALVTAGAGGCGLLISRTLADLGARVMACDVDAAAVATLRAQRPDIHTFVGDVSDEQVVQRLFAETERQLGGIGLLVNNVGIAGPTAAIEAISSADWNRTLAANITSHFLCARAAVPGMKSRREGLIVNISSGSARTGLPLRLPYVVSKVAVLGMTSNLARELGPFGIRVNAILPGPIRGERMQRVIDSKARALGQSPQEFEKTLLRYVSLRCMVEPEDIAEMIAFLASSAGRHISGQRGMLQALALAAADYRLPLRRLPARGTHLIHGTTHAINAIIVPGPACYARGGRQPTVTDASLVLGHIDPDFFLGGAMPLDARAAHAAIAASIASPLGRDVTEAAAAIIEVATESMVQAIVDITVNQGIDPRSAVLIGGGGAAGLNSVKVARRLGCRRMLVPAVGAALSAAGALMSDLRADYDRAFVTRTDRFDFEGVNRVLAALRERCAEFIRRAGATSSRSEVHYTAQARYTTQVWELETRLPADSFGSVQDLERLIEEFHRTHEELFGFADRESAVEIIGCSAHVSCRLTESAPVRLEEHGASRPVRERRAYFAPSGWTVAPVYPFAALECGVGVRGPAIVESAFTTVVIDPGATAVRCSSGSLSIDARNRS